VRSIGLECSAHDIRVRYSSTAFRERSERKNFAAVISYKCVLTTYNICNIKRNIGLGCGVLPLTVVY